eukprot:gene40089-48853_t
MDGSIAAGTGAEVINGSLTGDFTPNPQTGYAPLGVSFSNSSASSSSTTPSASITSAWSFGNGTSSVTTNVYETNSNTGNIEWNGTNQAGKDVPAGTYFYIIKAT